MQTRVVIFDDHERPRELPPDFLWVQGDPTKESELDKVRLAQARAVIDDLLAAPTPDGPIELVRPKVMYQFADPGLEARSAGQKMMIRMGPDNADIVKEKLRVLRGLLAQDRSIPRAGMTVRAAEAGAVARRESQVVRLVEQQRLERTDSLFQIVDPDVLLGGRGQVEPEVRARRAPPEAPGRLAVHGDPDAHGGHGEGEPLQRARAGLRHPVRHPRLDRQHAAHPP